MQIREINQHHIPAIISILALLIADSLAYYFAYTITDNLGMYKAEMPFPWRVYFLVIYIIYLFRRYNPSPRISRIQDANIIIKSIYMAGIIYIFGKILKKLQNKYFFDEKIKF